MTNQANQGRQRRRHNGHHPSHCRPESERRFGLVRPLAVVVGGAGAAGHTSLAWAAASCAAYSEPRVGLRRIGSCPDHPLHNLPGAWCLEGSACPLCNRECSCRSSHSASTPGSAYSSFPCEARPFLCKLSGTSLTSGERSQQRTLPSDSFWRREEERREKKTKTKLSCQLLKYRNRKRRKKALSLSRSRSRARERELSIL